MEGRDGNDLYFVGVAGDVVNEANGGGTDTVRTSVSYTLAPGTHVEVLSTTSNEGLDPIDLTGNQFDQAITGNDGENVLRAGRGNDALNGQGGDDTFVFDTNLNASTNVDTITGFDSGDDTIELENAIFSGLPAGTLNASAFVVAATAQQANDRIIYDSATGALYFDPDGTGAADQVQFATLVGLPAIANTDFVVT
jgi:serralysin